MDRRRVPYLLESIQSQVLLFEDWKEEDTNRAKVAMAAVVPAAVTEPMKEYKAKLQEYEAKLQIMIKNESKSIAELQEWSKKPILTEDTKKQFEDSFESNVERASKLIGLMIESLRTLLSPETAMSKTAMSCIDLIKYFQSKVESWQQEEGAQFINADEFRSELDMISTSICGSLRKSS
eukprot:Filipodium_phascolosomae@DN6227_c0_g1_i1.p1